MHKMCINVEINLSQLCSRLIFEVSWFAKWSSTYFILYIDTLATLFGSCWPNSLHLDIELGRKYNWVSFNMTWLLVQHRLVVNWDFLIQQPNDQKRKIYEWAAILCRIFFVCVDARGPRRMVTDEMMSVDLYCNIWIVCWESGFSHLVQLFLPILFVWTLCFFFHLCLFKWSVFSKIPKWVNIQYASFHFLPTVECFNYIRYFSWHQKNVTL